MKDFLEEKGENGDFQFVPGKFEIRFMP